MLDNPSTRITADDAITAFGGPSFLDVPGCWSWFHLVLPGGQVNKRSDYPDLKTFAVRSSGAPEHVHRVNTYTSTVITC